MSAALFGKTLLDTNALLHFTLFPDKLTSQVRHFLEEESQKNKGNLFISIISALEIGLLVQKKRLPIQNPSEYWKDVCEKMQLHVVALSSEIIFKSFEYHKMNADPFDRIIIASSVLKKVNLLTSDTVMQKYFFNPINNSENLKIIHSTDR